MDTPAPLFGGPPLTLPTVPSVQPPHTLATAHWVEQSITGPDVMFHTHADLEAAATNYSNLEAAQKAGKIKSTVASRQISKGNVGNLHRPRKKAPITRVDVDGVIERLGDDVDLILPPQASDLGKKLRVDRPAAKRMMMDAAKQAISELPDLIHMSASIRLAKQQELANLSVLTVTSADKEGWGTVNDPRLGSSGNDSECKKCYSSDCPGHYGLIRFHRSMPNPAYMNSGTLIKVLNCLCLKCAKLRLSPEEIQRLGILSMPDEKRLAVLSDESAKKACDRNEVTEQGNTISCIGISPTYIPRQSMNNGHITYTLGNNPEKHILSVTDIMKAFGQIRTEDARVMGFPDAGVPMSFIMQSMLVPPIQARPPSIIKGVAKTGDLTQLLIHIVEANIKVKTAIDAFTERNKLPIFSNPGTLCDVLQSVCINCGQFRLSDQKLLAMNIMGYPTNMKLQLTSTNSIGHSCDRCGNATPYTYIKELTKSNVVYKIDGGQTFTDMPLDDVISLLSTISDWTLSVWGITRQQMMSLTNRVSQAPTAVGKTENIETAIMDAQNHLYDCVATYQSFVDSLITGKEALIRGMMLAKRSNFCARGVISPEDSIRFGEIVIPLYVAKFLTPEIDATEGNVEHLRKLMVRGRITHVTPRPGSLDSKGRPRGPWSYSATSINKVPDIQIGDKIERWLQTGDMILAGRQPTIHKYNVMAYRVVIKGHRYTIGFLLAVTGAVNGDFDGDEMSLWLPQSKQALKEAYERMYVCRNIVSQANNVPVVGSAMDSITSILKMTVQGVTVDPDIISESHMQYQAISQLPSLVGRLKDFNIDPHSGKALFSSLLPEDFQYSKGDVNIINGVLIRGRIESQHLSRAHRSIVQDIYNQYGWERVSSFINDATRVARNYAESNVISVGYDDCDYGDTQVAKLMLRKQRMRAEAKAASYGAKRDNPADEENREAKISGVLREITGMGVELSELSMDRENTIRDMSKVVGGGAKGDPFNTAMMGGMAAQQFIQGSRPAMSLDDGTRTLSYYRPGEDTIRSRGFCEHSFSQGQDPDENFMHNMATRPQLTDTPLKVGEVGDMHRKISMAMAGCHVGPKGQVMDFDGVIFQFLYGEDGFDASRLMKVPAEDNQDTVGFIDLRSHIDKINASYGWVRKIRTEDVTPSLREVSHLDIQRLTNELEKEWELFADNPENALGLSKVETAEDNLAHATKRYEQQNNPELGYGYAMAGYEEDPMYLEPTYAR